VLAEIGITFQGAWQTGDPLSASTLRIDETKLDDALLNHLDGVRRLFTFGLSSSSSEVVPLGSDADTRYIASGYQLNIAWSGGVITSANIDGPADGSDNGTVAGNVLTVTAGGAKGLKLLYTGTGPASGIQLDLSVGVGAKLYQTLDGLLDDTSGLIANEVDPSTARTTRPGARRSSPGAARSGAGSALPALRGHGDRAHHDEPAARQPAAADRRGVQQQEWLICRRLGAQPRISD
jgi:flagellar capping protein FliD